MKVRTPPPLCLRIQSNPSFVDQPSGLEQCRQEYEQGHSLTINRRDLWLEPHSASIKFSSFSLTSSISS